MSKRDNPRLKENKTSSAKNKRSAHSIGSDGKLHADKPYASRTSAAKPDAKAGSKAFAGKRTKSAYAKAQGSFPDRYDDRSFEENPNLLIGRNPVMEAIRAGRTIDKILAQKDIEGSAKQILAMAREQGIQIQYVDKAVLDRIAFKKSHQGIAAYAAAHDYADMQDIIDAAKQKGEDPLIVLLDNLEDPHNLGAILRSADGAGAHGVVIPSRRSVSLTETVAKASAGAIEYVPVAKVSNLASAIDKLKEAGIWTACVDMDGENYHDAKLAGPLAIVIGSEGFGVSHLVKEKCDFVISIPMRGRVNSLNASNAAAVVLYEVERQRSLND